MDMALGVVISALWISIGFGTKNAFKASKHGIGDFPLLVMLWPVVLLMAAYVPGWFDERA